MLPSGVSCSPIFDVFGLVKYFSSSKSCKQLLLLECKLVMSVVFLWVPMLKVSVFYVLMVCSCIDGELKMFDFCL